MKITYFLLILFFSVFSCGKISKTLENSEALKNNLNTNEKQSFKATLKNFYQYFYSEKQKKIRKFFNDTVLTLNKLDVNYSFTLYPDTFVSDLIYAPGENVDTFIFSEFPTQENGKWKNQGVFIDKYNGDEFNNIKDISGKNLNDVRFKKYKDKIYYKVLDTKHSTITYWGKQNGKWIIFAVEFLN